METEVMTRDQKAFFLSVALGCFEAVKLNEEPGSVMYRRLDKSLNNCLKAVNMYVPEAWGFDEMNKASMLIDEMNERVKELFPG